MLLILNKCKKESLPAVDDNYTPSRRTRLHSLPSNLTPLPSLFHAHPCNLMSHHTFNCEKKNAILDGCSNAICALDQMGLDLWPGWGIEVQSSLAVLESLNFTAHEDWMVPLTNIDSNPMTGKLNTLFRVCTLSSSNQCFKKRKLPTQEKRKACVVYTLHKLRFCPFDNFLFQDFSV